MDNGDRFVISPYPARPNSPWKLEIRVAFAGKKIRRFFATKADAQLEGERLAADIIARGVRAATAPQGDSVATAVRQFLASNKAAGRHRVHLERFLADFVERYGRYPISAIGPLEVEAWWTRPEWPDGKAGRRSAYLYLNIFFSWADRYELINRNPCRKVDRPKKPAPLKNILTPAEMKEMLTRAKHDYPRDILPYLVLGGFAGLRTAEIQALRPEDVDLAAGEIHVRGGKTGERFVTLEDAARRHLPATWALGTDVTFTRHRRAFAGGHWPANCLRHSFATYHLARSKDAGKTAYQMGHTDPRMVQAVYALAARNADAAAWWGL